MPFANRFRIASHLALAAALVATTGLATAQDSHARRGGTDQMQGHDQDHNQPDFHFQDQHREQFQQHYRTANKWANNDHRAHFERGQAIPRNYTIQAVPSSYYRGAPPPPRGYRYGYYQGYVVSYNPTTRIIADVLDLATGH